MRTDDVAGNVSWILPLSEPVAPAAEAAVMYTVSLGARLATTRGAAGLDPSCSGAS